MSASASLTSAWKQQAVWSRTASRLKREIERTRAWILGLVVATAVLGTAAAQLAAWGGDHAIPSRILAALGAVLMALAGVLQTRARAADRVPKWIRARSASEAIKEQVFRYLTRAGRYDVADPERVLRDTVGGVVEEVHDLEAIGAAIEVPDREPPPPLDPDGYVKARVESQIDGYYRPQAKALALRRDHWQRAQAVLLWLGAVLAALVAFVPSGGLTGWIAVLTTIAGALGAHLEAAHYDQLVIGYRMTAARLESLRDEWRDTLSRKQLSREELAAFVDRCEGAISVENQAWMAERAKDA